jgi:hypothetical protein
MSLRRYISWHAWHAWPSGAAPSRPRTPAERPGRGVQTVAADQAELHRPVRHDPARGRPARTTSRSEAWSGRRRRPVSTPWSFSRTRALAREVHGARRAGPGGIVSSARSESASVRPGAVWDWRSPDVARAGRSTAPTVLGEIWSFRIEVPEKELADLPRRIAATRWPRKELGTYPCSNKDAAQLHHALSEPVMRRSRSPAAPPAR